MKIPKWVTADYRELSPKDFSMEHLLNLVNYLSKKEEEQHKLRMKFPEFPSLLIKSVPVTLWLNHFVKELDKRQKKTKTFHVSDGDIPFY